LGIGDRVFAIAMVTQVKSFTRYRMSFVDVFLDMYVMLRFIHMSQALWKRDTMKQEIGNPIGLGTPMGTAGKRSSVHAP
jgi:hypothetical protein